MQEDERTAAPSGDVPEPTPDDGAIATDETEKLRSDNARLKRDLAATRGQVQRALPYVDTYLKLSKAPGGGDILERLQKGEPLTARQEARVEGAAAAAGLTTEQFEQRLARFGEDLVERLETSGRAKDEIRGHVARAERELEGFADARKSDKWATTFETVQALVASEGVEVPVDQDRNWWAIRHTYDIVTVTDPKLRSKRENASKDATTKTVAAKVAGSRTPSVTSPSKGGEEHPEAAFWRGLQKPSIGRSYTSRTRR